MSKPNFLKGIVFVVLAFFFMALFGVVSKIAALSADLFWVNFLTLAFSFLILLPFVAYRGFDTIKTKVFPLHFLRAFIGLSASFFYLLAITKVPLANATLLYSSSPFFIPLMTLALFNSHLSYKSWMAIFIGFIGITIIIRPSFALFVEPGNLYGLIAGILLAGVFVMVSILVKTESILTILFYFAGLGALIQLPVVLLNYKNIPSPEALPVIATISAIFISTQYCLAYAYQNAPPDKIGVFQYLTILFVGLFDWAIWNQVPGRLDLLGAAIVIIAGIITIREGYGIKNKNS